MKRQYVVCYYAGHDASLAIVGDGKIFHFERERFSRVKHDSGDMKIFLDDCYKNAGIDRDEIIAAAGVGGGDIYSSIRRREKWGSLMDVDHSNTNYFGPFVPVCWIPHHTAHAAYAFYTSIFEKSKLFAIDGGGDNENDCTVTTAFGEATHNFGDPNGVFELHSVGSCDVGASWAGTAKTLFGSEYAPGSVMALVGIPEDKFTEYSGFDMSVYKYIHELQDRANAEFIKYVGSTDNLAAAGGCALNGIAMYNLLKTKTVKKIHVPPAVHDGGLTVGACLYVLHSLMQIPRLYYDARTVAFSGYTDEKLEIPVNAQETAKQIANGELVALAYGRAESGPRALGHRSILADPRDIQMKDRINTVKGRQPFRPVAPVILNERAGDYFNLIDPLCYDYMTTIADSTDLAKKNIPAGLHYDGSSRVQIVDSYHPFGEIVSEFYGLTGVPVILNTSLNRKGEPICNTWAHVEATAAAMGLSLAKRIA